MPDAYYLTYVTHGLLQLGGQVEHRVRVIREVRVCPALTRGFLSLHDSVHHLHIPVVHHKKLSPCAPALQT